MLRVISGTMLCAWAVVVFFNNQDFLDGFLFPFVTGTIGVSLVLSGWETMRGLPAPASDSASAPEKRTPIQDVRESANRSGAGAVGGQIFTGIVVSVVSGLVLKVADKILG